MANYNMIMTAIHSFSKPSTSNESLGLVLVISAESIVAATGFRQYDFLRQRGDFQTAIATARFHATDPGPDPACHSIYNFAAALT
jgi:hypothetical protein